MAGCKEDSMDAGMGEIKAHYDAEYEISKGGYFLLLDSQESEYVKMRVHSYVWP